MKRRRPQRRPPPGIFESWSEIALLAAGAAATWLAILWVLWPLITAEP